MNIVKAAIAVNTSGPFAGSFDTLIELVVKLDLAGPLSERGKLTVFAPTDGAFAAAGITDVDAAIAALGKVNASAGTIDGAPIIVTDVYAFNGIIHAVSGVLLP